MDLMSRIDLFHRLEQRGKFSEPEAASIIHNTLVTVRFRAIMHPVRRAHRGRRAGGRRIEENTKEVSCTR